MGEGASEHAVILERIRRLATWPVASLAMLAMWACQLGFQWRRERLDGIELLDPRQWYTPEQAAAVFEALDRLDPNARSVYAITELTLDMAFPLSYGLLFAILLTHLCRGTGQRWVLLPVFAAMADMLENVAIATLAFMYDGRSMVLAWPATAFSALKSALILTSLLAILAGAIRGLRGGRTT